MASSSIPRIDGPLETIKPVTSHYNTNMLRLSGEAVFRVRHEHRRPCKHRQAVNHRLDGEAVVLQGAGGWLDPAL